MHIRRKQLENLKKLLQPNKAVIIYGARRVGKTTLIQKYLSEVKEKYLILDGEDIFVQNELKINSIEHLKKVVGSNKLLVIDEAQKIENIGTSIKLIVDHIPKIKVIVSGSSSFDLANNFGEPLTGRKYSLKIFPLSQLELSQIENPIETTSKLEERLLYGSYPEVVLLDTYQKKENYLREIVNSYLLKDILQYEGIRNSDKILKILQLIALQIGQTVSYTEIGTAVGMSKNTVESYLDLLEKVFVIYKQNGFSKNLRKEITKNPRYYFWDLGIRNTLINNYSPISLRNDAGFFWQNYIINERNKINEYNGNFVNQFFWRTYDKQELDLIEVKNDEIKAFEIKMNSEKLKIPAAFKNGYPDSEVFLINKKNYLDFII